MRIPQRCWKSDTAKLPAIKCFRSYSCLSSLFSILSLLPFFTLFFLPLFLSSFVPLFLYFLYIFSYLYFSSFLFSLLLSFLSSLRPSFFTDTDEQVKLRVQILWSALNQCGFQTGVTEGRMGGPIVTNKTLRSLAGPRTRHVCPMTKTIPIHMFVYVINQRFPLNYETAPSIW